MDGWVLVTRPCIADALPRTPICCLMDALLWGDRLCGWFRDGFVSNSQADQTGARATARQGQRSWKRMLP